MVENVNTVTFTTKLWRMGKRRMLKVPDGAAARVMEWGPEKVFVLVAPYDEVKGKTLTVEVGETKTTETTVEREKG